MTLDEAIRHTEDVARIKQEASIYLADEHPTQAEKCEECAKEHRQLAEWLKELKAYKEQSGDAISRQAVMEHYSTGEIAHCNHVSRNNLLDFIEQLPSVTPQQRTGQWVWDSKSKVYRCSCCKRFPWRVEYVTDHDEIFEDLTRTNAYKYCPNCGCKMQEEE